MDPGAVGPVRPQRPWTRGRTARPPRATLTAPRSSPVLVGLVLADLRGGQGRRAKRALRADRCTQIVVRGVRVGAFPSRTPPARPWFIALVLLAVRVAARRREMPHIAFRRPAVLVPWGA
jgi:hypothetical protein